MATNRLDADLLRTTAALLAAEIAVGAAIDRCVLEGLDEDSTTLDLLVRLDLAPGRALRAVDLSDQLMLSPSHISRRLDRAEAEGLIERHPDPDDRRARVVTLTAAGRTVVAEMAPRLHAVLDQIVMQRFSPGEIDTLVSLLERLEAGAKECSIG